MHRFYIGIKTETAFISENTHNCNWRQRSCPDNTRDAAVDLTPTRQTRSVQQFSLLRKVILGNATIRSGSTLTSRHLALARKGQKATECTDGDGAIDARASVRSDGTEAADDRYEGQACFHRKTCSSLDDQASPSLTTKSTLPLCPSAKTLSKTVCMHSFLGSGEQVHRHVPINGVSTSILLSVKQKTKISEDGLKDVLLSAGEEF